MAWQVYLSGEIHTDWRERIEQGAIAADLDIEFTAPVTDHAASDAAGTAILGESARSGTTTSGQDSMPFARGRSSRRPTPSSCASGSNIDSGTLRSTPATPQRLVSR